MRRRIERSRARCERAAINHKTDKEQEAEKQSGMTVTSSLESDEKGG
jgi:hypothetical protein